MSIFHLPELVSSDFGSGSSEGHRPPISRAPTHRVLVFVNLGGAKADATVKSEGSIEPFLAGNYHQSQFEGAINSKGSAQISGGEADR